MKPVVTMAMSVLVLAIAGSSTLAHAAGQSKTGSNTGFLGFTQSKDSLIDQPSITYPKTQSKIYQFDLKGKWGVKFDVNQPETAPSGLNDIDAGAFYKLTPSLRVGGTVGFGEKSDPLKPEPKTVKDKSQPRVKFETKFKF
ncbi:NtrZ family periplasmic regulatory protein [Asticcacaulis sp. AC402]|uniref:NtrZ family periplasmic regulatory protein n=1 Tax=Asticcacaulis sp. AC402 TaxID=1282361 RepID=UPI0003C3DE7B|nr:hypothetical protein [Asticcacaulis sp. AC402]ESQ75868.1 hypothetical protein ABAC402_07845 [Asticcacaulis sp. AC402]